MEKIVASNEELETVAALVKDLEVLLSEVDSLNEKHKDALANASSFCAKKEETLHKEFLTQIDEINACSVFNKTLFEREHEKFVMVANLLNEDSLDLQKEVSSLMTFISGVK